MFRGLLKRLFGPKLFGPEMLADPYPYYARLRSADPVHWSDQIGGWVLTRYADVTTLLRSPNVSADRANKPRNRPGRNSRLSTRYARNRCSTPTRRGTRACACWST